MQGSNGSYPRLDKSIRAVRNGSLRFKEPIVLPKNEGGFIYDLDSNISRHLCYQLVLLCGSKLEPGGFAFESTTIHSFLWHHH
jgi:hypothetical protein